MHTFWIVPSEQVQYCPSAVADNELFISFFTILRTCLAYFCFPLFYWLCFKLTNYVRLLHVSNKVRKLKLTAFSPHEDCNMFCNLFSLILSPRQRDVTCPVHVTSRLTYITRIACVTYRMSYSQVTSVSFHFIRHLDWGRCGFCTTRIGSCWLHLLKIRYTDWWVLYEVDGDASFSTKWHVLFAENRSQPGSQISVSISQSVCVPVSQSFFVRNGILVFSGEKIKTG